MDGEPLFVRRIRDAQTRSLVRRHLGDFSAVAVTDNFCDPPRSASDPAASQANGWDDELRWLEHLRRAAFRAPRCKRSSRSGPRSGYGGAIRFTFGK
jgi:hypothetical protein